MMALSRATFTEVKASIETAISAANPAARAWDIERQGSVIEGMGERQSFVAYVELSDEVVTDGLFTGLKELSMDATHGIEFVGDEIRYDTNGQEFAALKFEVNMMDNCTIPAAP